MGKCIHIVVHVTKRYLYVLKNSLKLFSSVDISAGGTKNTVQTKSLVLLTRTRQQNSKQTFSYQNTNRNVCTLNISHKKGKKEPSKQRTKGHKMEYIVPFQIAFEKTDPKVQLYMQQQRHSLRQEVTGSYCIILERLKLFKIKVTTAISLS